MATELALAKRRTDAYARIGGAIQTLAKGHKLQLADIGSIRHRTPGVEQTMRIEALADNLEALVKLQSKPSKTDGDLKQMEQQLEAETGHDVVKTSDNPPTFVETDKPAPTPKVPRK